MHQDTIKHYIFLSLKTIAAFFVYLFFLTYTPHIYGITKDFFNENFVEPRVIVVGPVGIKVRVVDNPEERAKGLSGTEILGEKEGMFFVFEEEDKYGIWMKDMKYPIDIIWFDSYGSIVHIEEKVSPNTYPKVFKPTVKSKYVLEVNSGFVEKNNIKVGDTIDLF